MAFTSSGVMLPGGDKTSYYQTSRLGVRSLPGCLPQPIARAVALANFWLTADKTRGCWIWEGPVQKRSRKGHGGYGLIQAPLRNNTNRGFAHRAAWEIANGRPIPPGMCVLHQCDTPACINPDHLQLGTYAENSAEMVVRNRKRGRPRKAVPA